ncbi:MAG: hypothetical protein ABIT36_12750, partial [Steroidobacteraceae bacterium]
AQSLAHGDLLARRHAVALALSRYDDPKQMPVLRLRVRTTQAAPFSRSPKCKFSGSADGGFSV